MLAMEKEYRWLLVSKEGHTARIYLNRPPVNALNREMVAELTEAAETLQSQEDVWLVTVAARGKTFSAGADLKERASIPREEVAGVVKAIQTMVSAWIAVPQPVIMAIQGAALGGGLEFALAGDILIASDSAILGFPEVGLGIMPAAGGTQRMLQRSNLGTAKKWMLTASKFSAHEAMQDGIVDFVFPNQGFERESEKLISTISALAPLALRQTKKTLNEHFDRSLADGLMRESENYSVLIRTEDRDEALRAFLEGRRPTWKGK
jgi:enoyl-CoA hydratase/carnithine racemase